MTKIEHFAQFNYDKGFLSNVVYIEVGKKILGNYLGYEGGGQNAENFFLINKKKCTLSFDGMDLGEKYTEYLDNLVEKRSSIEDYDNDDQIALPSSNLEKQKLKKEKDTKIYKSKSFKMDILKILSTEWSLHAKY
ncbi:hypothetical protein N9A53_03340 [Candidatus Pelagibacter ubique]|nr:hypothetical protein [Candidatus Pelagibacter ubique]